MRKRILFVALLLLASLVCVASARRPPEPARWDYKATCGRVDLEKMGEDGWELAAATQSEHITCLYFKRPK